MTPHVALVGTRADCSTLERAPGGRYLAPHVGAMLVSICYNKAFRHLETLFVQGRNLYLAGLLLVSGK